MIRAVRLNSGERSTVVRRRFSSVPVEYRFEASAADGGKPMGWIEVRGSTWIMRKPVQRSPLLAENVIRAGFWDTFLDVKVIADQPLDLRLDRGPGLQARVWILLAVLIVAIAATMAFLAR